MDTTKNYVKPAMKLNNKEAVLRGVQYTNLKSVVPSGGSSNYSPSNNNIEFIFTDGEGINMKNSYVRFFTNMPAGATVTSACDFFEKIELYIGNTSVLSTTNSRVRNLINIMMKNELSRDWFEHSGHNLLGWSSYNINENLEYGSRMFCVPLWCIHPALMMENLPVLGEQIRIVLTLARPEYVLDKRTAVDNSYELNQVELVCEQVVYEPDYKVALMKQIQSAEGYSIPMVDFDVNKHSHNGSSNVNITHRNQRSNALSLFVYDAVTPAGRNDVGDLEVPSKPTLHTTLGSKTVNFKCFSGNRNFTKLNGDAGVELLCNLERVGGGLGNENNGTITYKEFTSGHDGIIVSPLAVSFERTDLPDSDLSITNRGISSYDVLVDADIQVQLQLSSNLNTTNDELYSAIVYEKTLVFADGSISVDA